MTKPETADKSVNLDKKTWEKIIMASAGSTQPIDDDTLREMAAQRGDDPDELVARHREFRDILAKKAKDDDGPMPIVV